MTIVGAAAARYFVLVFGAGFVLGMIRVPLLVPRLGERVAELVEVPVMLAVIVFAARHVVRRHAARISRAGWAVTGLLALALLLAAEAGIVVMLQGRSAAEFVADRDPVSGSAYLASLALFAAMPWLLARRGRPGSREDAKTP